MLAMQLRLFAFLGPLVVATPLAAQGLDTIRVRTLALHPMRLGTDTLDVEFEAPSPTGPQRSRNVVTRSVSRERHADGEVLHVAFRSEAAVPRWDVYLDPKTLQTVRYEQYTATDSIVMTIRGDCMAGWRHLAKEDRKSVECERFTDRFAAAPVDELIAALLPLRAGWEAALATYGPVLGKPDHYAVRVASLDTLTIAESRFVAWRVIRSVKTERGALNTTLWVDRKTPRILRTETEFGNGRRLVRTLRNP